MSLNRLSYSAGVTSEPGVLLAGSLYTPCFPFFQPCDDNLQIPCKKVGLLYSQFLGSSLKQPTGRAAWSRTFKSAVEVALQTSFFTSSVAAYFYTITIVSSSIVFCVGRTRTRRARHLSPSQHGGEPPLTAKKPNDSTEQRS